MNLDLDAVAHELARDTGAPLAIARDGLRDVLEARGSDSARAIKVYARLLGFERPKKP